MTVEEIAESLGAEIVDERELADVAASSYVHVINSAVGVKRPAVLPSIGKAEANARKRIAQVQQDLRRFKAMDCECEREADCWPCREIEKLRRLEGALWRGIRKRRTDAA